MFLEHVNLTVSNVERSAGFYCDLLGLQVRWKGTTGDGTPAAHVGDDRSYLALFQSAEPGRAPSDYTVVGLNHFGFVVKDIQIRPFYLAGQQSNYVVSSALELFLEGWKIRFENIVTTRRMAIEREFGTIAAARTRVLEPLVDWFKRPDSFSYFNLFVLRATR